MMLKLFFPFYFLVLESIVRYRYVLVPVVIRTVQSFSENKKIRTSGSHNTNMWIALYMYGTVP